MSVLIVMKNTHLFLNVAQFITAFVVSVFSKDPKNIAAIFGIFRHWEALKMFLYIQKC